MRGAEAAEGMCERLEARINALEEEVREKDERFKAQDERIRAQEAVMQGLLTALGATVETAAGEPRVLVKTSAAEAASGGGAGPRPLPPRPRRSLLSGGGQLAAVEVETQLAVWNNPICAGTNLSANEEEGGGGGAAGQASARLESKVGTASTPAGAGEVTATDDAAGDAPGGVDDDAPVGRMLGLQVFLMCGSIPPAIGFLGIGALVFDHAPSHLMGWAAAPIGAMSIITHWLVTVELREETVSWLEEAHLVSVVGLWGLGGTLYYMKQGLAWLGLGWAVYMTVLYAATRVCVGRIRDAARAHCLREGTLGKLVDDTFVSYLEFMVVVAYGFLSSVSCLTVVEANDQSNLLDAAMWDECGPVNMVRRARRAEGGPAPARTRGAPARLTTTSARLTSFYCRLAARHAGQLLPQHPLHDNVPAQDRDL